MVAGLFSAVSKTRPVFLQRTRLVSARDMPPAERNEMGIYHGRVARTLFKVNVA